MPMLERTAASLEPCSGIQRVLPLTSTTISATSRRKLHTAFWHHGAADLELSRMWQVLVGGPLDPLQLFTSASTKHESMTASAFLLDFLYPIGAAAFLKRLSPRGMSQHEQPSPYLRDAVPRMYYSSGSTLLAASASSSFVPLCQESLEVGEAVGDRSFQGPERPSSPPDQITVSPSEAEQRLSNLLTTDQPEDFEMAWALFAQASPDAREKLRPQVMSYIARSTALPDAWRISELFAMLPTDRWEEKHVAVAIKAELALQNLSRAVSIFIDGVQRTRSAAGLGAIVAFALRSSSWEALADVWGAFTAAAEGSTDLRPGTFKEVRAMPELFDRVNFLLDALDKPQVPTDAIFQRLRTLVPVVVQKCLPSFRLSDAFPMLSRMREPRVYEEFIPLCVNNEENSLAEQAYAQYRQIPDVVVKIPVLRCMIKAFFPENATGMEQLLKDWYGRYGRLDRFGYSKFLAFYASRGDVASVEHLWKEYIQAYPNAIHDDRSCFSHLIDVHGIRHDVDGACQAFDDIEQVYQSKPSIACWNSLMQACLHCGDYDRAVKVFSELSETVKPNQQTFSVIMSVSGARGDLDFTLDLYRMAKEVKVKMNMPILFSVVGAYCENDRLREAEHVCLSATRDKSFEDSCTELWNILLENYARRRDLMNVNRILSAMTKFGVAYNDKTYDNLLLGLVYCRQSHHALHLLRVAVKENMFRPTAKHYVLLMTAFLQTREPHMVLKTDALMDEMGLPRSSRRIIHVMRALSRWKDLPAKQKKETSEQASISKALEVFYKSLEQEDEFDDEGLLVSRHDSAKARAERFSVMITILAEMKDFISIREIISLYQENSPDNSLDSAPSKLLSTIMLADFYEGNFKRVVESWEIIFARIVSLGRPAKLHEGEQARGIVPRYQFSLVEPLKTMQMLYEAQNDGQGLVDLVSRVTAEGFRLDSKSWNQYVQTLARLKRYREAFIACEEKLMPQWQGWYRDRVGQNVKNQLPLQLRRLGNSPKYLRPTSHTLLVLAKAYVDLEQMTPWSRDAGRLFAQVRRDCPQAVKAVKTMQRSGSELESEILDVNNSRPVSRSGRSRTSWATDEAAETKGGD